jgi:hypothetical protein
MPAGDVGETGVPVARPKPTSTPDHLREGDVIEISATFAQPVLVAEGPILKNHAIKNAKLYEASEASGENVRRHADTSLKVAEVPGAEE